MPRNLVLPGKPGTHTFPPLLVGEGWGEGQATTPSTRFTGLDPVPTVGSGARLPPTRHPPTNPSLLPKRNEGALGRGRPWGAGRGKNHPSFAPHRHPNLSSRTLLLSSRAKPRDLKRSSTPTPLFTNIPDHRRAGETRYPPNFVFPDSDRGPRGAATSHTPTTHLQPPVPPPPSCRGHPVPTGRGRGPGTLDSRNAPPPHLPRLAGLRSGTHPFFVFPDSDRGPRGAATSHTPTTHPQPPVPPPPSCRGNPVPTGRGRGPGTLDSRNAPPPPSLVLPDSDPVPTPFSSSPTPIGDPGARLPPTHPRPIHNPPVPTPLFVVPGTPGTHGGARASGADSPSIPIPRCHPEPYDCHPERSRGT